MTSKLLKPYFRGAAVPETKIEETNASGEFSGTMKRNRKIEEALSRCGQNCKADFCFVSGTSQKKLIAFLNVVFEGCK
jgi:hypothetical protein